MDCKIGDCKEFKYQYHKKIMCYNKQKDNIIPVCVFCIYKQNLTPDLNYVSCDECNTPVSRKKVCKFESKNTIGLLCEECIDIKKVLIKIDNLFEDDRKNYEKIAIEMRTHFNL